jgi:hypothetical protein
MAMLGRKMFNPNTNVPPVNVDATPYSPTTTLNDLAPVPQIAPPKPGHNWIGILADALSGLAGGPGIYAPMAERRAQEQSAFERGEQQYQTHHSQDLADQYKLLDYKRLHPDDALSQSLDQAGITDPVERQKYYKANADRLTAPPMMSAQGVDEQGNPVMRFFPRAQPVSQQPMTATNPKTGEKLRMNPQTGQWEPIGGQTQPASGGFR